MSIPTQVPLTLVTQATSSSNPARLNFAWNNINIRLKNKKRKDSPTYLIQNQSGNVRSGECLAILGSSGAGKTTLLNFLSRRIETKSLVSSGAITLNSNELSNDDFAKLSAYVMQDDILEAVMTPSEILLFTAKLKLGLSDEECESKVSQLISDLHLDKCSNTRIGNNLKRGVSGGERKRTSIAVELISDPKIVFLDEPTTGLDSFNAYELIKLLHTLAIEQHKVIIFTIHQPCSEIFNLLDKLLILALGKTVFFGKKEDAFDCFSKMNHPIPQRYNPFDFFVEVTNAVAIDKPLILKRYPELKAIDNKEMRFKTYIDTLAKIYNDNKESYCDKEALSCKDIPSDVKLSFRKKKFATSCCKQYRLLFLRKTLVNRRDITVIVLKICQGLICGLFVCALYFNISRNSTGIMDRQGMICVGCILAALTNMLCNLLSCKNIYICVYYLL